MFSFGHIGIGELPVFFWIGEALEEAAFLFALRGIADEPCSSVAMGYALPPKKRPTHLRGDTFALFDVPDAAEGRKQG